MASYITKSLYVNYAACPRQFYYAKFNPEELDTDSDYAKSIIQKGVVIGKVAHLYFKDTAKVNVNKIPNLELQVETTRKLIEDPKTDAIAEASFIYNDLYCAVDILKRDGDGWAIYEVKASADSEKDKYYPDVAFQKYVLEKCGLKVNHYYLMHLNRDYVRHGDIDVNQLLIPDSYKYDEKFIEAEKMIDANLDDIRRILNSKQLPDYGPRCTKSCPFFTFCHKDLPIPNLTSINHFQANKAHEYFKQGIVTYKDALKAGVELKTKTGNVRKEVQVQVGVSEVSPYINKEEVAKFLHQLKYPLYHLDFETYSEPIPPFDGAHPYQVVPFQYSLDIELTQGGKIDHHEFLAEKMDAMRELAEQLCKDIPMNVTSIAFNANFERNVIKHLAEKFPDLSDHLTNIQNNIVDLAIPFMKGYYYDIKQGGSNSIKYVMPALCPHMEDAYLKLPFVHNGGEAMTAFPQMMEEPKDEEYQKKRQGMLMYCALDTLSMVKVLNVLYKAIK